MEWSQAKKFVLILLIILNVALAVLNYEKRKQDVLTVIQERAIFEVLSKNGLTMYTDLKTSQDPMYRLEAQVPEYNQEEIEEYFFDGVTTTMSNEGHLWSYTTELQSLYILGHKGVFEANKPEISLNKIKHIDAVNIAKAKMKTLETIFGKTVLNQSYETPEGWVVEFSTMYQGDMIFSNQFRLFVSHNGLYKIEFEYLHIEGVSTESKSIITADEALLSFMRDWKNQGNNESNAIQRVELGYYLIIKSDVITGTRLYLEPCYTIYLLEEIEPYVVNAYTGQMVSENEKDIEIMEE